MVKAELSYNPYVVKSRIKFNGQEPRINSMVERYQDTLLHSWIQNIPSIFHDEMNGYYFELEFSGTKQDYLDLKKAFQEANVGDELVHLFHKNELNERNEKMLELEDFFKWLEEYRCRFFDYNEFRHRNSDLLDGAYIFHIINGEDGTILSSEQSDISIENINRIDELKETDLSNAPLLFIVDQNSLEDLKDNISSLLNRKDVIPEQLFFQVDKLLNEYEVERILRDLGMSCPQMVNGPEDDLIKKYFQIYPFTHYIASTIQLLRQQSNAITQVIREELEKNEITNKEIHDQINDLEKKIEKLKLGNSLFTNRDNLEVPREWTDIVNELFHNIAGWKKWKTKVQNVDDAGKFAGELERNVQEWFQVFISRMEDAILLKKQNVETELINWYQTTEYELEYQAHEQFDHRILNVPQLFIHDLLMELKEEVYVEQKEDLIGILFKNSQAEKEKVLETTYYLQKWREYVADMLNPIVNDLLYGKFQNILQYFDKLSEMYQNHISRSIEDLNKRKEAVTLQLSEEERLLQEDSDWLIKYCDRIEMIERG